MACQCNATTFLFKEFASEAEHSQLFLSRMKSQGAKILLDSGSNLRNRASLGQHCFWLRFFTFPLPWYSG